MPSCPASDLSSGRSIADTPPVPARFLAAVVAVVSTCGVVSVTEKTFPRRRVYRTVRESQGCGQTRCVRYGRLGPDVRNRC